MTTNALPLLPLAIAEVPQALTCMLRQAGVPIVSLREAPFGGRFVLYDSQSAAAPRLPSGQTLIDVNEIRRMFDGDPFIEHSRRETARTVWQVGRWEASEETASVDRGRLRRSCLSVLRRLVEQAGGVWGCVSAYPAPYRGAFCFRFDHDDFVPGDFDAVLAAIQGFEAATTHFVCASTHAAHPEALARLKGLDVGSHGYRHHTYRSCDDNVLNMARGIESLQLAGLAPVGFAAPHGRFQAELQRALQLLGISHSSEFALAFDDLPFAIGNPVIGDASLQLPIHPVCLGIVLEAVERQTPDDAAARHRAVDAVAEHFIRTAQAKFAAGEPVFLYGHPDGRLGRYPQVLRRLLSAVGDLPQLWRTNFTEFARWWRRRDRVSVRVDESHDGWAVTAAGLGGAEDFAFELGCGDAATQLPLAAGGVSVSRSSLTRQTSTEIELPKPIRVEPLGGYKDRLRRWLDWERVTPIDEISPRPFRNRIKRALRRVKERR